MTALQSERRHYRRIFFQLGDRFGCRYRIGDEAVHHAAHMLNLSLGGIGLRIPPDVSIRTGSQLILCAIAAPAPLTSLCGAKLVVRYSAAEPSPAAFPPQPHQQIVGCEFIDLAAAVCENLRAFMQAYVKTRIDTAL